MKNQYVGDIGDYGKYGLLRFLAVRGLRIGVNWYLTKNDGSSDGKFTKYLDKPEEAGFDEVVFRALKSLAARQDKSVRDVEQAGLIPGAAFYHEPMPEGDLASRDREAARQLWFGNSFPVLKDAELIFADPDNGVSYRKKAGGKGSERYILPEEIAGYYNCGKNVVFYCHKGRRTKDDWEKAKARIRRYLPDARLIVLTFHRGTQRSYIFVLHPADYERYEGEVDAFAGTEWGNVFDRESVAGSAAVPAHSGKDIVLEILPVELSVCKVSDYAGIDIGQPFVFSGCTDQEKSLVCPTCMAPADAVERDDGWRAFRIRGELDFSLIGILAGITRVLADARIGIFAISTFNTDYVLVKGENLANASAALSGAGYHVI